MDGDDFKAACQHLRKNGFAVRDAWFDEASFGNWFIDFASEKNGAHRIAWDGRDGWLILQAWRDSDWQDVWIAREGHDQTLERALAAVAD